MTKSSLSALPVESKQVAEGIERVVIVLFVFDELTDDPRTCIGTVSILELFRNTGGVLSGVDHLVVVGTVAGYISLTLLPEGDSILLLSATC